MAVNRNGHGVDSPHSTPQGLNQFRKFVGHTVADRVRDVERGSTRPDHCLQHFTEKVDIGPAGIFSGELHVFAERPGQLYAVARLLQTLPA